MSSSDPILVAAIDFGTTFSGYAFSFRHDYLRDPLKISANNWIAEGQALVSLKTPTTILLKPDKSFHSFGYEAENKYSDLADDNKHEGWLYFRRFKMLLHKNKVVYLIFKCSSHDIELNCYLECKEVHKTALHNHSLPIFSFLQLVAFLSPQYKKRRGRSLRYSNKITLYVTSKNN